MKPLLNGTVLCNIFKTYLRHFLFFPDLLFKISDHYPVEVKLQVTNKLISLLQNARSLYECPSNILVIIGQHYSCWKRCSVTQPWMVERTVRVSAPPVLLRIFSYLKFSCLFQRMQEQTIKMTEIQTFLFGFELTFKYWTIYQPYSFGPFKIWTCSVFEPPLYGHLFRSLRLYFMTFIKKKPKTLGFEVHHSDPASIF